jgi:hypothetical protein
MESPNTNISAGNGTRQQECGLDDDIHGNTSQFLLKLQITVVFTNYIWYFSRITEKKYRIRKPWFAKNHTSKHAVIG